MRIPEHLTGRRVTCPRCGEAVAVPQLAAPDDNPEAGARSPELLENPATADAPPDRFGVTAVALGLVAVLILCLPGVGYVSPLLSGVGLLLGGWGLLRSLHPFAKGSRPMYAGGGLASYRFGTRATDFPLAGTVACLVALVLALLPFLAR